MASSCSDISSESPIKKQSGVYKNFEGINYLKRACEFMTSSGMKQEREASFENAIPSILLNAEIVPRPGKLAKLRTRSDGPRYLETSTRRRFIFFSTSKKLLNEREYGSRGVAEHVYRCGIIKCKIKWKCSI